jgi:hypothetical protein
LYDGGACILLTKEHRFICLWTLDQRFAEALQKEAGSSDFYDFPFFMVERVFTTGWIVAGALFRIAVSRLISSRKP